MEINQNQVNNRINESENFLKFVKDNWNNICYSPACEIAISYGTHRLLFNSNDTIPYDGEVINFSSYKIYTIKNILNNDDKNKIIELINIAKDRFDVGTLGSIFTDVFEFKNNHIKITLNNHNPITKNYVLYFDACLSQEL